VDLYICHLEGFKTEATLLASDLRKRGLNVAVDLTDKKIQAQLKLADKEGIGFIVVVGDTEIRENKYKIKNLSTGVEIETSKEAIADVIKSSK
jgi:histidyl-tRNA synthetase